MVYTKQKLESSVSNGVLSDLPMSVRPYIHPKSLKYVEILLYYWLKVLERPLWPSCYCR